MFQNCNNLDAISNREILSQANYASFVPCYEAMDKWSYTTDKQVVNGEYTDTTVVSESFSV